MTLILDPHRLHPPACDPLELLLVDRLLRLIMATAREPARTQHARLLASVAMARALP